MGNKKYKKEWVSIGVTPTVEPLKEAWDAVTATPAYKVYAKADKAHKKELEFCWKITPEYKNYDEARKVYIKPWKTKDEACKAEDEALDALMATPEWKAFREIWEAKQ